VQKDGSDTSRTNKQTATENQNGLSKLTSLFFQGSVDQRGGSRGGGAIELLLLLRIFPELRDVAKGKVYSFRVYEEDLNEIC
jgi:hypothetical protein